MTHEPELLSAMLDGEITEGERARVSAHLETCVECRIELDDLAAARAAVRSLPLLEWPDEVRPSAPVTSLVWRRVGAAVASVAAAAAVSIGALAVVGLAAEPSSSVDVGEAERLLVAASTLDPVGDGSAASAILTGGRDVDFSARRVVACRAGDTVVGSTVDVTHIDGMTVVADPLADLTVLTPGSVSQGPSSGPVETVTVTGPAPTVGGYTVASVTTDEFGGRPAEHVQLAREGAVRASLWVDQDTGVVLSEELVGATGLVDCVMELEDFAPIETPIEASIPFDIRAQTTEKVYEPVTPDGLPSDLAGVGLTSVYSVSGGQVGIYGDGLLDFAVVRVEGATPEAVVEGPIPLEVWQSDGITWAVIGALPADLFAAVVSELPRPTTTNPVTRGWRTIFG